MEPLITPWDQVELEEECEGNEFQQEAEDSPLVQALREHFTKYYREVSSTYATPYSSRNCVAAPLNLEFLNSQTVKEMSE
jgi:hypothetical protein